MDDIQPPSGLYRTLADIGNIAKDQLVYFHNHGDPGPGIFAPEGWRGNRAEFGTTGQLVSLADAARYLDPVPEQGFYRVTEQFFCCERRCQLFFAEQLVQLGYDEHAEPILFTPQWEEGDLRLAEEGIRIDAAQLRCLAPLRVAEDEPAD